MDYKEIMELICGLTDSEKRQLYDLLLSLQQNHEHAAPHPDSDLKED